MESNLKELRNKAYSVAYGGLFALFVITFVSSMVLPQEILGLPKSLVLFVVAVVIWYALLVKAMPRCPNCGMGLFSIIEIGRFPVVLRSWVGDTCSKCGAPLK
jgi:hypothetical protein